MRYSASEKLEIIRTVETSHLPVRRTLDKIGIPKSMFYAWLDRYAAGGLDAPPQRRPRLLSDNGPSYVASDLSDWLQDQGMKHTRGKPYHPMTQGKIERWHLSLKSRILLENYYLPGDLERAVADFVEHYNHRRYHESLDNLTPANVYFGRGPRILQRREEIKRKTIEQRRRLHLQTVT
jgi:putative transposase